MIETKFGHIFGLYQNAVSKIIAKSSVERNYLFGIAIILVILYHTPMREAIPGLNVFKGGMVGVDIFLLFSGYGLCFSLNKNKLSTFYSRRYTRILPLFICYAAILTLYKSYQGEDLSPWDWFCNLSTLSYYQVGGTFVDWYLSALCMFYLLFPFLYRYTNLASTLTVFITVVMVWLLIGRPYWTYDCAISRLPLFMAGIMAYKDIRKFAIIIAVFFLFLPVCFFGDLGYSIFNVCYVFALITILLTPFILNSKVSVSSPVYNLIGNAGKRSLELYIANIIVMSIIMPILAIENVYLGFAVYMTLNVVICIVIVVLDRWARGRFNSKRDLIEAS